MSLRRSAPALPPHDSRGLPVRRTVGRPGRWVAVAGFALAFSGPSVAVADSPNAPNAGGETPAEEGESPAAERWTPPPPVGVRLGESLEGHRLRVAYSFERIRSQGLMAGDNDVSQEYARGTLGFTQLPRSLEVTVHTVQIAYAPHPRVTLVVEVPFVRKEIERVAETLAPAPMRRQEQTEGVGDVGFSLVVPFIRKGAESSQIHVGFDAPTGSFRRGGDLMRLAYDSQIGNGTWDFEWGWTYKGELDWVSWGGQAIGRHPLGRNDLDYREGARFVGRVWGALRVVAGLSASLRAEWEKQNNMEGFDRSLRPAFDPSENPKLRGGSRITLAPGLSFEVPALDGQRVSLEVGIPVYQDLDGPQLERDWTFKTGWQWTY